MVKGVSRYFLPRAAHQSIAGRAEWRALQHSPLKFSPTGPASWATVFEAAWFWSILATSIWVGSKAGWQFPEVVFTN
jgi:hypothetical protein